MNYYFALGPCGKNWLYVARDNWDSEFRPTSIHHCIWTYWRPINCCGRIDIAISATYQSNMLFLGSTGTCQYIIVKHNRDLNACHSYRMNIVNQFYPVLCPKLTLIQPTWSAYPYNLVFLIWYPYSLVFLIWYPYAPLPYMVVQPIVLGIALLWAAMDSSLSQGPLLWRHNDMTVIVSRNTRGRERDTQKRLDNANARRLQTVNR